MNNTITKTEDGCNVVPFEKCVICDKQTVVPINEHVDFRKNYIEGGGQLCQECFNMLDNKKYIRL